MRNVYRWTMRIWEDNVPSDLGSVLDDSRILCRQVQRLGKRCVKRRAIRLPLLRVNRRTDKPFRRPIAGEIRGKAAKQSVQEFKAVLRRMAEKSKEATKRPLIVMIDELDRCRPTYAIEVLEVAKHSFSVENIVFVLAINRSELAHSIQVIYGDRFDAEGYLRRFFDIEFQLPDPDRGALIDAMFVSIGLDSYLQRTQDTNARRHSETVQKMVLHPA